MDFFSFATKRELRDYDNHKMWLNEVPLTLSLYVSLESAFRWFSNNWIWNHNTLSFDNWIKSQPQQKSKILSFIHFELNNGNALQTIILFFFFSRDQSIHANRIFSRFAGNTH